MNFIFLSPNFPENYWNFCRGLKNNGIRTLGIGDAAYDELRPELKEALDEYYQVGSLENYDEVYRGCAFFAYKYGKIDWLESNNEYWLERDAQLREDFNVRTGVHPQQIRTIRYKSGMKAFYEKAGVKTARYHLTSTFEEGKKFIEQVGYPVVVKPDNGMGAAKTYKINNEQELTQFYSIQHETQMIMEEFITGLLVSYDGIANREKQIVYETSHVFPTPIMDIVNDQRDVYFYSLKEVPEDLRQIGRRVVEAFDTNSRFFHCEYFRLTQAKEGLGEVGDIVGLEVNMRPPGGNTPDMMNYARNINVYQIWANMVAYNDGYYDFSTPSTFCVYASRRDEHQYRTPLNEVADRYQAHLVMNQRVPQALSLAMGNSMLVARFDSMEEAERFISDVVEDHR